MKSEILSINFSYCYFKIHCLILWQWILPKQGIFTSCIDHLKNSDPLEVYGVAQSQTQLKWLSSSSSRGKFQMPIQFIILYIYIYIFFLITFVHTTTTLIRKVPRHCQTHGLIFTWILSWGTNTFRCFPWKISRICLPKT